MRYAIPLGRLARAAWLVAAVATVACSSGEIVAPATPDVVAAMNRGGRFAERAAFDAVMDGNAQAIAAAPTLVPPGAPLTPFIEARLYAIANVAMHDALNAINPEYARYADHGPLMPRANAAAAVLTAAHDAIVGAAPGAQATVDAWYATEINALNGAPGYNDGVALGHRVANAILTKRANDGVTAGGVAPYTPGSNPGDYRFTFPFNTPGFDFFGTGGFADASVWGQTVTPFVVQSSSQFRAPRPYGAANNAAAVLTPTYTADYNEIKLLGCELCAARSVEQTEIAKFWVENSPTGWNRIARTLVVSNDLSARETARVFALLQMGEFDSYSTSLESKYYYRFWRPVSAVELAATDGNPLTATVAGWQVLVFPTPPVPDYPSAHAEAGGTAAEILERVVRGKARGFSTTSGSLPGAVRRFNSLSEAARENADSRVFVGYHFRHATDVGLAQGRKVGSYVSTHALGEIDD